MSDDFPTIDKTHWEVHFCALSFKTKEEADAYRVEVEDLLMGMPESDTLTFFSTLRAARINGPEDHSIFCVKGD